MAKELIDVEKSNRKNPKKKIKENIDPETGLNLSSPSSQSTIQMAGDGKGTSSAPKKKKKKINTKKGPGNNWLSRHSPKIYNNSRW